MQFSRALLVALALAAPLTSAVVTFSRTVTAIGPDGTFDLELDTIPPSGACKSMDDYGSKYHLEIAQAQHMPWPTQRFVCDEPSPHTRMAKSPPQ